MKHYNSYFYINSALIFRFIKYSHTVASYYLYFYAKIIFKLDQPDCLNAKIIIKFDQPDCLNVLWQTSKESLALVLGVTTKVLSTSLTAKRRHCVTEL